MVTVGRVASGTEITDCDSTALVDVVLAVSPLYFATTLSVPTGRLADVQCAMPLLSVTLHTAPPLTVKLTVPVGDLPVTLAVRVTLVPAAAGLIEVLSAVLVAARLAEETWTLASVADTVGTLIVMP